ncbi:MAG: DUF1232 domain-containing protein [Nocardioidaceae bacterium]
MGSPQHVVIAIAAALGLAYAVLLLLLVVARPDGTSIRETLRLLPDVVRLVRRLAGDATLPRGVRLRLWLLLLYLASPIDVVPDFVPVLGYADDVVVVVLTLRGVIRRAGPEALQRHWPGTADGLATLHRVLGLRPLPD